MGGKVVKFRVLIGAAVLLAVIAAAEYAVKSYYYPKKTEKESHRLCDHRDRFGLFSCRLSKI